MGALVSSTPAGDVGAVQVIDVSGLARRRARVVRGAPAAQWAVALAMTWGLAFPLAPEDPWLRSAWAALLVVAIWKAVRFTAAVRRGRRGAVRLALAACAAHVVMLVLVLSGVDDGAMVTFARSAAEGTGGSLYSTLFVPGLIVVAVAVVLALDASRLGDWLRERRLVRRWPLRWLVLGLTVATVLLFVREGVAWLVPERVALSALWAIIQAALLVGLVAAAAAESVHDRRTDGASAWEPSTGRRDPRVFTGRHRLRVITLVSTSAVAAVTGWFFKQVPGLDARVLGVLLIVGAVALYLRASRWAALSAAEVRGRDPRRPVLYLRSFDDDRRRVLAHGSTRRSGLERWALWMFWRRERFEVILGWHLWGFGPLTAVGRPSERLWPTGAAREYLDEETWDREIEPRIGDAAAIVVVLGRTDGLLKELRVIERLAATSRMLLVVPPLPREEATRRWDAFERVADELGWSLPDPAVRDRMLVGLPRTDRRWLVFTGRRSDEYHYEVAIEAATRTLPAHRGARRPALTVQPPA